MGADEAVGAAPPRAPGAVFLAGYPPYSIAMPGTQQLAERNDGRGRFTVQVLVQPG